MRHLHSICIASTAVATLLFSVGTFAVDGVILIDQNKALAGNVTPGDAPGFPVTISQPGSYRLASNLTLTDANTTVIDITVGDVTIDLNGFSIRGPTTCSGTPAVTSCAPAGSGSGIVASTQLTNITVQNGIVRGMPVFAITLAGLGHIVDRMHTTDNGNTGITMNTGRVSHSTSVRNGADGIFVNDGVADHNVSTGNRFRGITLNAGIASYNNIANNGNVGLLLGFDSGYTGNTMHGNAVPVSGGVSLGGGNHNVCNGVAC
jgi:hypothetical protein